MRVTAKTRKQSEMAKVCVTDIEKGRFNESERDRKG